MSVAVECSDGEFRSFRTHLDGMGVRYKYYMRKDPSKVTTFYLEVTPSTEAALQIISDYAKEKGLKAELEVDGESQNLLEGDIKELAEKAVKAQKRGGLVRGYQY